MRFEVGQQSGDYEFLELVESSATGVTYRVLNTLVARQELLKVLPRDLQEDPERVERFLREAKIHARLHHPNIAAFYNATRVDNQLVMTSELVEGTSLEQRIAGGSLTLEQAAKYFEQALRALSYAHQEGVVHRDLTPGHLMITAEDDVKVTGFGLAKKPADPQLTQTGIVMGSLHYMSPEQVKGSNELDRRSDIYSLGVVLYEAVTGKKPFDAKHDFEVFMAHVNEDPPPPSSMRGGLPPEFDQIIRIAMAKQPADRFQTADEFRNSLATLQGAVATGAAGHSLAEPANAMSHPEAIPPAAWGEMARATATEGGVAHEAEDAVAIKATAHASPVDAEPAHADSSAAWGQPPHRPFFDRSDEARSTSGPRDVAGPQLVASVGETVSHGAAPEYEAAADYASEDDLPEIYDPTAEPLAQLGRSAASAPSASRDDTWPDDEGEPSKEVPLLLRSTDDANSPQEAPPAVTTQKRGQQSQPWLGDETFAGWTTKDIVAVGALTFVIVAAIFFALLTLLNR